MILIEYQVVCIDLRAKIESEWILQQGDICLVDQAIFVAIILRMKSEESRDQNDLFSRNGSRIAWFT